ncbi:hypothetical protein FRC04_002453 [Tulasnella sp. 424]|nr:hypothetical protein FRC04_002453 [Tulasnella sp. 424]KAG8967563.1 hypothetical protein FRC05_001996 [Tulasnella sp. 425]
MGKKRVRPVPSDEENEPVPAPNSNPTSSKANKSSKNSAPKFTDFFGPKGKGRSLVQPKQPAKASKKQAYREMTKGLRKVADRSESESDSETQPKAEPQGSSSSVRRTVAKAVLIPYGLETDQEEIDDLSPEAVASLQRYGFVKTADSDGRPLQLDTAWSEDDVIRWFEGLFPDQMSWLDDNVSDPESPRWELLKKRYHKLEVISVKYPWVKWTGDYLLSLLPKGRESSGTFLLASTIEIPENVYRRWAITNSAEGSSLRRRRQTSATGKPPAADSDSDNPAPKKKRKTRAQSRVVVSDSDDDLPDINDITPPPTHTPLNSNDDTTGESSVATSQEPSASSSTSANIVGPRRSLRVRRRSSHTPTTTHPSGGPSTSNGVGSTSISDAVGSASPDVPLANPENTSAATTAPNPQIPLGSITNIPGNAPPATSKPAPTPTPLFVMPAFSDPDLMDPPLDDPLF